MMEDIFQNLGNHQTLSQKIERAIEAAIRDKKLPVGSKLPSEHEMCQSFGVSRTALREALRRLSARGLITIQKGSGTYVSEMRIEDAINSLNLYYDLKFDNNLLSQFIEVRRMFEPEIARLAAQNRTPENLEDLSNTLRDFTQCDAANAQVEADLDNRFHSLITASTQNPIVQITMEPIYMLLPRMRIYIYGNMKGEKENTVKSHQKLLHAIEHRQEDLAFEVATRHLAHTRQIYEKFLKPA